MSPSLVFLWQAIRFKMQHSLNIPLVLLIGVYYGSEGVKSVLHCKSSSLNSSGTEAPKKHAILKIWQEE